MRDAYVKQELIFIFGWANPLKLQKIKFYTTSKYLHILIFFKENIEFGMS